MAADPFLPPSTRSSSCSFDLLRKKKGFSMEKSILVSRLTREKVERKAITQEIEHYFFPLSLPFFLVLRSHSERITCRRFFFCEWTQWLVIPSSLFMHAYPSPPLPLWHSCLVTFSPQFGEIIQQVEREWMSMGIGGGEDGAIHSNVGNGHGRKRKMDVVFLST